MTLTAEPNPNVRQTTPDGRWAIRPGWVMPHPGPFELPRPFDRSLYDGVDPEESFYAPSSRAQAFDLAIQRACERAKEEIDRMTFHAHAQIEAMYLHAIGAEHDYHTFVYKTYIGEKNA